MKTRRTKNAFELERYRSKLASKGNYLGLKATYKKGLPEIDDLNTPKLWDKLNRTSVYTYKNNPMAYDRIMSVSSVIMANRKLKKILNIGLGEGSLENAILSDTTQTREWYGIDFSKMTVESITKRFNNGEFIVGDLYNLPYKENSLDCVVALEVLEHIRPSKILGVYAQISRVLKKSGTLIVSVPLNEGLEDMVKRGKNPNAHVRAYTVSLICAEIDMSGFNINRRIFFYAFGSFYKVKTFLCKHLLKGYRKPNIIVLVARKK